MSDESNREEVEKIRREAAYHRTEQKTAIAEVETLEKQLKERTDGQAAIAKALGLDGNGEQTPEQLIAQFNKSTAGHRQSRLDAAFAVAVSHQGADHDLTKGILGARNAFGDLDPADDGLDVQVAEMVEAVVTANPKLKIGVPNVGSGDQGARGWSPQLTGDDVKDMTPAQVDQAMGEGRLDTLLGKTT